MRTATKKDLFLEAFRDNGGNALHASKAAGISRVAAYKWRETDLAFAARWDEIIAAGRRRMALLARAKIVVLRDERGDVVLDQNLDPFLVLDLSSVDRNLVSKLLGRPLSR